MLFDGCGSAVRTEPAPPLCCHWVWFWAGPAPSGLCGWPFARRLWFGGQDGACPSLVVAIGRDRLRPVFAVGRLLGGCGSAVRTEPAPPLWLPLGGTGSVRSLRLAVCSAAMVRRSRRSLPLPCGTWVCFGRGPAPSGLLCSYSHTKKPRMYRGFLGNMCWLDLCLGNEACFDRLAGDPHALHFAALKTYADALNVWTEATLRVLNETRTDTTTFLGETFTDDTATFNGAFSCDCANSCHGSFFG